MNTIDVALICKALGDSNRLQIIQMLFDGEKCGCKLLEAFDITQPTLSHHMKLLCDCGLVDSRKDGRWMHYSISEEGRKCFKNMFSHYLESSATGDSCSCNKCE